MHQTVPGVSYQSVVQTPPVRLRTGVPGFVGFARPVDPGAPATASKPPVALQRKEEFADAFEPHAESHLAGVVAGFFDNGGERCYVVGAAAHPDSDAKQAAEAFAAAFRKLELLADLDLVAVPDAMALVDETAARAVQQQALKHCFEQGNRFAILDPRRGAGLADLLRQRDALVAGLPEPIGGALYYPWVTLPEERRVLPGGRRPPRGPVPPCGHVAGIYARTDAAAGVFKAPANAEVLGIADLEDPPEATSRAKADADAYRVNCLRAFPGRGIRVWGARTLSRQEEWRYVNVRRLFLTVRRWIDLRMTWASFEPNDARLWNRVRRELEAYLSQLWREGAFAGTSPEQAYFVRCDAETNPPESRELGQVVTEIGLAPAAPAEFIVVRITQQAAATA